MAISRSVHLDHFWGSSIEALGSMMFKEHDMGLSENSVPLHPMVNDHYPY